MVKQNPVIPSQATGLMLLAALALPAAAFAYHTDFADLNFRASVSEAHDDNITYVKDNRKSDSITNINLELDAKAEGKTQNLSLTAAFRHQFYEKYSDFDNTSEYVTLNFNKELSKYSRFFAAETFNHSEEPRSFADEFGRTSGRYSYIQNDLNLEYTHDFTQQFSMSAHYANSMYDPSRSDLSGSYANTLGLQSNYAFNSKTIAYATYDFFQRNFDPGTEASFNILSAGLREYFTSQLYLDSRIGVNFINSFNERNYTKPLFQASLTDEFDEQSRGTISFVKTYNVNAYSEDLFNYWQASAALSKQLMQRLKGSLNAFYGKGTYTGVNIRDTLSGLGISLDYDLLHNMAVNAQYSYSQTSSNDSGRDYKRNYIAGSLRIEF